MGQRQLLYRIQEKPPVITTLLLGLQYAILTIPGTVIAPLIVANIVGIPDAQKQMLVFVTLLISGISSFIQIRKVGKIGSGYMLFLGSSSAYITACITAGMMGGFGLIATMTILSAPLEVLMSYFLRFIRKIITPAVGGIVIILIAIGVTPIMMELWTGRVGTAEYCSPANLIVGGITLLVTILAAIVGKKHLRLWSPFLGLLAGVVAAQFYGILDFSALACYPWIGLPRGQWVWPTVRLSAAHVPVFIAFLFATFASTVESIGDSITVQDISDPDFKKVDYNAVQGALYADGVGNVLAGLGGTMPNTTYSGNIAVISITGVASRVVGYVACGCMMLFAFMPKLIFSFTLIPGPVIGASTLVLMGLLYASGMKLIASEGVNYETSLIVGISISAGLIASFKLFFPDLLPETLKPFMENGVAIGGFIALLLTLLIRLRPAGRASLKLDADLSQLGDLQNFVERVRQRYGLDAVKANTLQLVSEELFAFLVGEGAGEQRKIRFCYEKVGDGVSLEVTDRGDFDDVDDMEAIEKNPQELGLFLLNHVASKVEHLRFGDYHAIRCEIE